MALDNPNMSIRTLLVLAQAAGPAVAQLFAPFAGRTVEPFLPNGTYTVLAFGDANGDGIADLCANRQSGPFSIVRRSSAHGFTVQDELPGVVTAAVWADVDGDGDLDLVVGAGNSFSAPVGVLRNDGATFTWLGQVPGVPGGDVVQLAVGDLDGDQRPEVVVGLSTGCVVLHNDGLGHLSVTSALPPLTGPVRPVLFDRDGDGDLDLAAATGAGLVLFGNTGGVLTNLTATLPATTASDVVAGDLDGDGRVDLAVSRSNGVDVLWNQGGSWLLAPAGASALPPVQVALADLDRDGARDLVVRDAEGVDWLHNDGARQFSARTGLRLGNLNQVTAMAVHDVFGRGDEVVCACSDATVRMLYGAAPTPFTDPASSPAIGGQLSWRREDLVGDVDGDGRAEILLMHPPRLVHDDGRGRRSVQPIPGADPQWVTGVLHDLDGDGDLDLLFVTSNVIPPVPSVRVALNDGAGHFTWQPPFTVYLGFGGLFGDVDGDGFDDLVIGDSSVPRLLHNDGSGRFTDVGPLPGIAPQTQMYPLVLADLDGDGRPEVVYGQTGSVVQVWHNAGGSFTAGAQLNVPNGQHVQYLAAVDLDGDGDRDLVLWLYDGFALTASVMWFRNDGTGSFVPATATFPPAPTGADDMIAFDADDDGDQDLYFPGVPAGQLWLNDGSGSFTEAVGAVNAVQSAQMLVLDVDQDGDTDLVTIDNDNAHRLTHFPNRSRSAWSTQPVHACGALAVTFAADPALPGTFVLPCMSLGAGPALAVPGLRGHFLLPANAFAVLGVLPVTPGGVQVTLTVPPSPTYVGLELNLQGLVFGAVARAGFTNVVDERVLP
jgi:hypothetical protein